MGRVRQSGVPPPPHIERAVEELGADRMMFGTDWAPTCRAEAGDFYRKSLFELAS